MVSLCLKVGIIILSNINLIYASRELEASKRINFGWTLDFFVLNISQKLAKVGELQRTSALFKEIFFVVYF